MPTLLNFIRSLGVKKISYIAAGILVMLGSIAFYSFIVTKSDMVILYSGLSTDDSAAVEQKLSSMGEKYSILSSGSIIKVREDRLSKIRMAMAEDGIPARGVSLGYKIFDQEESLGTTSFMQNIKLIRALEGELTRTIQNCRSDLLFAKIGH